MHLMKVAEPDEDGDLLLTIFARTVADDPMVPDNLNAPILARMDLFCDDVDVDVDPDNLPKWLDGKVRCCRRDGAGAGVDRNYTGRGWPTG